MKKTSSTIIISIIISITIIWLLLFYIPSFFDKEVQYYEEKGCWLNNENSFQEVMYAIENSPIINEVKFVSRLDFRKAIDEMIELNSLVENYHHEINIFYTEKIIITPYWIEKNNEYFMDVYVWEYKIWNIF
jgi:hypothetical protein